jgi:hypothetical protein
MSNDVVKGSQIKAAILPGGCQINFQCGHALSMIYLQLHDATLLLFEFNHLYVCPVVVNNKINIVKQFYSSFVCGYIPFHLALCDCPGRCCRRH